jgi:hypothetical protein
MQLQGRLRLATYLAPPLAVLCAAAVVACRDAFTSHHERNDAAMTVSPGISELAARKRQRLHGENKLDWVGVAHNRAIDDFRRELRKPGVISRRMCEYLADYSTRPERLPNERRSAKTSTERSAAYPDVAAMLCSKRIGRELLKPRIGYSDSTQGVQISPTAIQLISDVRSAVEGFNDSYELASRLLPILQAAANLDTIDQAAVRITVSVAQSSSEYWESELHPAQQEFVKEFGGCANQQYSSNYSSDQAFSRCVEGGGGEGSDVTSAPFTRSDPQTIAEHANLAALSCETLGDYLRRVITSDVDAGVAGFIGAMVRTKTPAIATEFALYSAAGVSIYDILKITWDLHWCAMMPRRTGPAS